jgi:hypothetical protein
MLSWSLRGEPTPPIEGGQSLAEAEPVHITDPIFVRAFPGFLGMKVLDTFIPKAEGGNESYLED